MNGDNIPKNTNAQIDADDCLFCNYFSKTTNISLAHSLALVFIK